jgi:hypothetical protein
MEFNVIIRGKVTVEDPEEIEGDETPDFPDADAVRDALSDSFDNDDLTVSNSDDDDFDAHFEVERVDVTQV